MIKIRITWPLLLFSLIVLLIWLTRGPAPAPARAHTPRPRPTIIEQSRTYDAETAELDREAAEAGRRARRPHPVNPLRRKESYRDRATADH